MEFTTVLIQIIEADLVDIVYRLYSSVRVLSLSSFFSYPVVSISEYKYVDALDLPAITISHMNYVKLSFIEENAGEYDENNYEHNVLSGGHQFEDMIEGMEYPTNSQ